MGNSRVRTNLERRNRLDSTGFRLFISPRQFLLIFSTLIFINWNFVSGQKVAVEPAMADNMRKFQELYGIATQLMNLGGNILNNAQSGGAGSSAGTGTSMLQRNAASTSYYGGNEVGNGILSDVVRPQLRGIPSVESSSFDGGGRTGGSGNGGMLSGLLSGYGGGPLGTGSKSQPRSILDTLMGSFLGSSIGSSGASSPNFFSPSSSGDERYGNARQGSNIEAIVDALSRSGAKRADSDPDEGGPTSFLSQLFGGRKRR